MPRRMMAVYTALIVLTAGVFWVTPAGFIPLQDQGYFAVVIQLPAGSSLQRDRRASQGGRAAGAQIDGIADAEMFTGMDAISQTLAPNSGVAFFVLKPFQDRDAHGRTMLAVMEDARKATARSDRGAHPGRAAAGHPRYRRQCRHRFIA